MKIAPLPINEKSRLACLYQHDILDTEAEQDFNDIVQLASRICHTPISVISLIDEHRQWFKAKVGLTANETPRDPAFCAHALELSDILEVPDATRDDRFFDNPFVTGDPSIRFYAGMPLTMPDGSRLGTLCVIDRQPRELTDDQRSSLRILGKQVVNLLELRLKVKELNLALRQVEEQKAEVEKLNHAGHRLLSIIGHDVRSPLAALCSLIDLCKMEELPPDEFQRLLGQLKSNILSATDLLGDLLEWACEQFEGRVMAPEDLLLAPFVEEEINANRASFERKGNQPLSRVPADLYVKADRHALSFMLRNLLLNANKFTEKGRIEVGAEQLSDQIRISVSDTGIGMTPQQIATLFNPTERCSTVGTRGEKGSGLGLHVCHEFAAKHGGQIGAESTPGQGSCFYFTLERFPSDAPKSSEKVA
jgi:signal transduction histidine kinase